MDKDISKLIKKIKNPYMAIAIALGVVLIVLFAETAMAQPGQDPDFIPPGHRGGPGGSSEQQQQQGQLQGQAQSSTNVNYNAQRTESAARADSDSVAISNSGGNRLSATGGRSAAGANATGGDSDATGGDSVANVNYSNDYGSASAASVWMGYCQSGGSGQTSDGGFSVVNSDQFCDHVRAAEAMLQAYERECSCVGVCTDTQASVELECGSSEKAQFYLEAYHENLKDAHNLVQDTQATGFIGRVAGQLAIPSALLAAIFLL